MCTSWPLKVIWLGVMAMYWSSVPSMVDTMNSLTASLFWGSMWRSNSSTALKGLRTFCCSARRNAITELLRSPPLWV